MMKVLYQLDDGQNEEDVFADFVASFAEVPQRYDLVFVPTDEDGEGVVVDPCVVLFRSLVLSDQMVVVTMVRQDDPRVCDGTAVREELAAILERAGAGMRREDDA